MFFCYIFVAVSLITCGLCDSHECRNDHCADKPIFTPSRLVVKHSDPTSVKCLVCERDCDGTIFDLETTVGEKTINGTTLVWTVDRMTEWDTDALCYYTVDAFSQCCSLLPVTVYQPPEHVSISFVDHAGPMLERGQYTLQCTVQKVAPVENLVVTFYRGTTALGRGQSNGNPEKKPVSENFTLSFNTSKEDNGAQYWCEAQLDLGPEGPQPPPVVMSEKLTATVYYGPQLKGSANPDPIQITQGNTLHLNCSAVGNPSPSYTWMLPSDSLPSNNGSVLIVKSVGFEHKGQYVCNVSSNVGTVTVNFNVNVQVNFIPYIIAGIIIVAVVVVTAALIGYCHYYKNNRMGHYNLLNVFRVHH